MMPHEPFEHVHVPPPMMPASPPHTVPHLPQFDVSFFRSMQVLPHCDIPIGH